MKYKDIPVGTRRLALDTWWCGDDYCNCHAFEIYADNIKIWESCWFNPPLDKNDIDEIKEEVRLACVYYSMKLPNFDDEYHSWESVYEFR